MTDNPAHTSVPTPAGDPPVFGVDNVLIEVGDLDAAVAHYRDGLGLPLKFRVDVPGIALFALGGETPGLLVRLAETPAAPAPGMRVWLEVPDARAAAATLHTRALAGVGQPFPTATGWTVEVADRWGNVVGFAGYMRRPEMGRRGATARQP